MAHPKHAEWKVLKKKHATVLKERKIVFKEDLGALIDKVWDLAAKSDEASKKARKEPAGKAFTVCTHYITSIRGLGGQPETELIAKLKEIQGSMQRYT